jgi:hypothetical protein
MAVKFTILLPIIAALILLNGCSGCINAHADYDCRVISIDFAAV